MKYTHPSRREIRTHPVPAQVVDDAGEDGVSTLRDGHVLERVEEVWLQSES